MPTEQPKSLLEKINKLLDEQERQMRLSQEGLERQEKLNDRIDHMLRVWERHAEANSN